MPPRRRFDKKNAINFHLVSRPLDANFGPNDSKYALEATRIPGGAKLEDVLPADFPVDLLLHNQRLPAGYVPTHIKGGAGPSSSSGPRSAAIEEEEALIARLEKQRASGKTRSFAGWQGSRAEEAAASVAAHRARAAAAEDVAEEEWHYDDEDEDMDGEGDWDEEQFADAEVIDFGEERRAAARARAAAAAAAEEEEEDGEELEEDDGEDEDPSTRAEMRAIARAALRAYASRTGEHIDGLSGDDDDDDAAAAAIAAAAALNEGGDGDAFFDDIDGETLEEDDEDIALAAAAAAAAAKGSSSLSTGPQEDTVETSAERAELRAIARAALRAYSERTGEHIEGLSDAEADDEEEEAAAEAAAAAAAAVVRGAKGGDAGVAAALAAAASVAQGKKPVAGGKKILPYSYDYNKHFRPFSGDGQFVGPDGLRQDPEAEAPLIPAIPSDDADLAAARAAGKSEALRAKHDGVMVSTASGLEIPIVAPGRGVKVTTDFLEALKVGNEQGYLDLEDNFYELAMMEPEEADRVLEEQQRKARAAAAAKKAQSDVIARAAAEKKAAAVAAALAAAKAGKRVLGTTVSKGAVKVIAGQKVPEGNDGDEEEDPEAGDYDDEDVVGEDDGLDSGIEGDDGEALVLDEAGNLFPAGRAIDDLSEGEGDVVDDVFYGDGDDDIELDPHAYLESGAIAQLRDELAAVGGSAALKSIVVPADLSDAEREKLLEKAQLMTLLEEFDEEEELPPAPQDEDEDEDDEDYDDGEGDDEEEDSEEAAAARAERRAARRAARAAARGQHVMYEDEQGLAVNPDGMDTAEILTRFKEDIDEVMGVEKTNDRRKIILRGRSSDARKPPGPLELPETVRGAVKDIFLKTIRKTAAAEAADEGDPDAVARAIDNEFSRPQKERWDAESIVSTYSNTTNIPVIVREVRVRAGKGKIRLAKGTDIPIGVMKKHRDQVKATHEAKRAAAAAAAAAAAELETVVEEGEEDDEEAAKPAVRAGMPYMIDEEDVAATRAAAKKASTAAPVASKSGKRAADDDEEEDEDDEDAPEEYEVGPARQVRLRDLTKEEKKAHKAAVKAERAAARLRKKQTKTLFSSEEGTQKKMSAENRLGRAAVHKFF